MWVLKFGGSSQADITGLEHCAAIIVGRAQRGPVTAVLSAMQGVTDAIAAGIERARNGRAPDAMFDQLNAQHSAVIDALQQRYGQPAAPLFDELGRRMAALARDLEGVRLLRQCPADVEARLIGAGERLSVLLMAALLRAKGRDPFVVDPTAHIAAAGDALNADVNIGETRKRLTAIALDQKPIALAPGFIAGNERGEQVTLGRNGSDYSAAVIAAACRAEGCEIWTDVDGVYTANPAAIPRARLVDRLSCREAMELSYFGAKVLHPKTIRPIARGAIPCWIKNTRRPAEPGTLIQDATVPSEKVKGVTLLDGVTTVNVSGPGMKGVVGMARRIFEAISAANASVALMTQSSSEYSITIFVASRDAERAKRHLEAEFQFELLHRWIEPLELLGDRVIVSLVGDGMRHRHGVAANLFAAMAEAGVNVEAIAQGSSESSISVAVRGEQAASAYAAVHRAFFEDEAPPQSVVPAPPTVTPSRGRSVAKAFAPASIGNFSVGFDVLGAAIHPIDGDRLGDVVIASFAAGDRPFQLEIDGPFADQLPPKPEDNLVASSWHAFERALAAKGFDRKPTAMRLEKNLPICSGLGSSSCSIVAALNALNELYGAPFQADELLAMMGEQEGKVSGSPHFDNVGPSYLGGLQLMAPFGGRRCTRLPFFDDWLIVVAYPGLAVSTKAARDALPAQYPKSAAIAHGAGLAAFIHALHSGEPEMAASAMQDLIAEPYRKDLLPNFEGVKQHLLGHGAIAAGISGSGSSLFAIVNDAKTGRSLTDWLARHYRVNDRAFARLCRLDEAGARLID